MILNKLNKISGVILVSLLSIFSLYSRAQCTSNAGNDTTLCLNSSTSIGDVVAGTGAGPLIYSWSPASGLSCTNCSNPVATPLSTTSYTLTVTDANGCTSTDQVTITVNPIPTANFTFPAGVNCANIPVQFTNTSIGSSLTYQWNFNNPGSQNNTTSQINPVHEFLANGSGNQNFNVNLIATNNFACQSSVTQTVSISQIPNPSLIDPLTGFRNCDGSNFDLTVYDNTITNPNSNYIIQWGDGTPDFNTSTFPGSGVNHIYTTQDIFNLNFIISGVNGCVDTTSYNVGNITNPAIGAANPGATTGCGPLNLCFPLSNYATNHYTTYYVVDYGDNSPFDTLPHPPPSTICHSYSQSSCGQTGNQYVFRIKAINLCDSSEASISPIRVYTGPIADFIPNPSTTCVGTPITFQNTSVLGFNSSCSNTTLFVWNFGDGVTQNAFTPAPVTHAYSLPGTYNVTLTASNSCGSTNISKTVCIEIPPVPNFNISNNLGCIPLLINTTNLSNTLNTCNVTRNWSVIFGGTTCTPAGGAFNFINGTNASSLNPQFEFLSPGNYTIRLTLSNTCGIFIKDTVVTAQTLPQVIINPLTSVCASATTNPSAIVNDCLEAVDTYLWNFTGASPTTSNLLNPGNISYSNAGTYPIQLSVGNACGTVTANTNITINPLPPALNPSNNSVICEGQDAVFNSDTINGVNYTWNGPNGFTSNNQGFTIPNTTSNANGLYTVSGSLNGCVGPVDSVYLIVEPVPIINVTPANATICLNDTVLLVADGATSYSWSPATGLNVNNNDSVFAMPVATTTYTVTGANGICSASTNVTVNVNPLPTVNAGSDLILCDQPIPENLVANPVGGTWSGPNITPSGTFTPNGTGTFEEIYTIVDANFCSNQDTVVIDVVAPTAANAGSDLTFCLNDPTTQLSALPSGGTWSGTSITSSGLFSPNTAGTIDIIYSFGSGSCATDDTIQVTVNNLPIVDAGSDISLCISAGIQSLSGLPNGGIWSGNGISNPTGVFDPSISGAGTHLLTYTFTDANACSNSDNLNATVFALPIVYAGVDTTICDQPIAVQLNATPNGGTWTGLNITPSGLFTPNGTGSFTVNYIFTDANGCVNQDDRIVIVNAPIQPDAGSDFSVCIDAPNQNLVGAPAGGTWSGTNVTLGGVFDPTSSGVFELIYTLGNGNCQLSDTVSITVNSLPIVDAGLDISLCISAGIQNLSALQSGGIWSGTGISNPTGDFDPNLAGAGTHILTYTFTDANACSNFDNLNATVFALPIVNAGVDTTICDQPIAVQLNATPNSGTWTGLNITPSGLFTPNGTGSFTVTYTFTDANGCVNQDDRIVIVNTPIQPDAGSDFSVCIDAPNQNLVGAPAGGTWSGTNVTSSGVFDPMTAGVFELIYTLGTGNCQLSDTILVTVNSLPIVDAGSDISMCIDAGIQTLSGLPNSGIWTGTGISNPTGDFDPSMSGAGTHLLTYTFTDANSCSNSDNLNATVFALPIVNAGVDTTLCDQPIAVQLNATPNGGIWTGLNITPSGLFTPNGTGNFTVNYSFTDVNGCVNQDNRIVTIVSPQISDAGADLEACFMDPNIQLNFTPASGTWTGTNVSSTGLYSPISVGTFALVLSNGVGNCLNRDTMLFTVNPLPIVDAGTDQDFCPDDLPFNFNALPLGGFWTGSGITNASTGNFDPALVGVGNHALIYTFTDPISNCVNSDTVFAFVHPFPLADFTYNPIACVGVTEMFTSTSTLAANYNWNFGDGNTSVLQNPSNVYLNAGFYNVNLQVTSLFGCIDDTVQSIEVREPPLANFELTPDSACGPVGVDFVDLSSGPSIIYNWNFGNGQTSNLANPGTQIYPASIYNDSLFIVNLTVTNFCGNSVHLDSVITLPSPTAIFGTASNSGCSPFTLDMVNNSIGLPDNYYWDFGDGNFSNTSNATLQHTFYTGINDTTFTIQLIVENECGSDTVQHTITVLPNIVNAFFNADTTSGCVPLTVNFTQFSQGSNFSSWDFGDGNVSTIYSPTHTFTTAGTYTVNLYANDGCGFDTTSIDIVVFPSPIVDFIYNPNILCINEAFQFTNQSINLASSVWDFGDGTGSVLSNPSHAYTSSGNYTVTLTGESLVNGCTASISQTVSVYTNPIADFTVNPNAGCMPLPVSFNNLSSNTNFQSWNFGDGNTSTQFSPNHVYTSPGTYVVTLYVENINGCRDSIQQTVNVYDLPIANFNVTTSDPCVQPMNVVFTNISSNAINYNWYFGDGQSSTLNNPSHTYTNSGTYQSVLIAENIYGCKDTFEVIINNYNQAIANFVLPSDSVCVGEDLLFNSTSTFADSISWFFGNNESITGQQVNYSYPSSGNYPITIIAYGAGGCNDTVTIVTPITVMPKPTADFDYLNLQAPDPLSGIVEFYNNSSGADYYYWNFGNGDTSTLINPVIRFRSYNDFEVMLIAINEFGCRDTIIKTVGVDFFYGLFIPNAMHPGNITFEVANFIPTGVGLREFSLLIYDDWGNLIWQTNALDSDGRPTEYWDGTFKGVPVQQDSYVWKASAVFLNGQIWEGKEYPNGQRKRAGTITVLR